MIVAQRLRGNDPVILNPRSRTLAYAPTASWVNEQRASMDTPNLEVARLNGLGFGDAASGTSSLPSWAPWAIGGLAVGLVGGFAVYKMRKGK
jgi:hypothetical protein